MKFKIDRKQRLVIMVVAIAAALIPIGLTVFELITTDKESVVFLGQYPASVSTLILIYYGVLLVLGFFWFTQQLIVFFRLKNENAKTELLHLKSQVSPHFFFNTLNNLYGLVETDPKKAKALLLNLSDIMRYSIYEGEKEVVTLQEEVEYLKKYMELHKMRYHKAIDVQFDCTIEVNHNVMPLLFIILVENAFKHGVEALREKSFVHILVTATKKEVFFEIENNFDVSQSTEIPGIGLKNLKRRLALVYPNRHTLSFTVTENRYKAQLRLTDL